MPTARIHITVEVDGKPIPGFPRTIVATIDEQQSFDYDEAFDSNDTTFSDLPAGQVASVTLLAYDSEGATGLHLEGNTTQTPTNSALRFAAGGGMVAWGLSGITNTTLEVNVNSTNTDSRVRGLAGGT